MPRKEIRKAYDDGKRGNIFIDKAKDSILCPSKVFNSVKRIEGVKDDFLFLLALTFANAILGIFFVEVPFLFAFVFAVLQSIVYVISVTFFSTGLIHIGVKIFGGKAGVKATYKALVYSTVPLLLFTWIPFHLAIGSPVVLLVIIVAIILWSLYNFILGLSILQDISKLRALGAIVTGSFISIFAVLMVGLALLLFVSFSGLQPFLQSPLPQSLGPDALGQDWLSGPAYCDGFDFFTFMNITYPTRDSFVAYLVPGTSDAVVTEVMFSHPERQNTTKVFAGYMPLANNVLRVYGGNPTGVLKESAIKIEEDSYSYVMKITYMVNETGSFRKYVDEATCYGRVP